MGPAGSVAPGTELTDEPEPVDEVEEPELEEVEAEPPAVAGVPEAAAVTQLQALAPPGAAGLGFEAGEEELAGEEGDDDVGGVFEALEGPTSSWLIVGEVVGACP
jgi:hypothetical protein